MRCFGSLSLLLALALCAATDARAAAVVNASTTFTPGAGNTGTITATFSLRQAAQGGVTGGQTVTLTVNFWEDDLIWDDFLGSTTVTVTLPASASVTGPFTTPPVTIPTDLGDDFYAEVKAAPAVGGASFALAQPVNPPLAEEAPGAEVALASLRPTEQVLQDPALAESFGSARADASLLNNQVLMLQPKLPPLPATGLPHDLYVARLGFQGTPETVPLGSFPTLVREDTSDVDFSTNLSLAGPPVFEGFDLHDGDIREFGTVSIWAEDLNGEAAPLMVLTAPLAPLKALVRPGDLDGNGSPGVSDVIRLIRLVLGLDPPTGEAFIAGDLDEDGSLSITDIVRAVRLALAIDTPPPPPPPPA